ncbi:MAG: putative DNA binding domain-containing protein [Chitinophagaceae bacterium]|nr:putative DNA binding domain-containing protein [Anaerolineae bacterium]
MTSAASDEPALKFDELQKLLRRGRSEVFDWLPSDTFTTGLAGTLAAMANSQGGLILIGIENSGTKISGISDSVDVIDGVLQLALSIQPVLIIPMPQAAQLQDKTVVIVQIPAGMPHVYALDGRYLYREGGANAPLNPRDLRRLLLERGEFSFETAVTPSAELDDLDWEKVGTYVSSLGVKSSPEQTLLRRGCLTQSNDKMRPTNAGILLFGKDSQRFVRGAEITAVRFAGVTMSDTFSRQDIIGTLPDQIRRAETFLVDHLRKDVALQHTMERKERYEYPMEAARELVVNAVAHRDYSISGDGIRLFIFKDHLEVSSPGGLPGPVTIANIKDERFSRNPVIVQVLSDMGFIERLGYGVDRVIELMRQQSLRAPEFRETSGGFRVVLYNDDQPTVKELIGSPVASELVVELSGEYEGLPVNPRQEAALAYLREPSNARITNSELQRLFPEVHAETIRRDLADLVTKNILSKMGEKRGSYYVMKKPETQTELQAD